AHATGADLTLQKYMVSRWSKQRQIVEFRQSAGYARYDIPSKEQSQYSEVMYSVVISNSNGVSLFLAPGGSYSINVPHAEDGRPDLRADSGELLMIEVAVRTGTVEVRTPGGVVTAEPGRKIQVDTAGRVSAALPAQWQLIRNGKLDNWPSGAKADASGTWIADTIVTDSNTTDQERNGTFTIQQRCGPVTPDNCTPADYASIGQFSRQGNQSKSFAVSIGQPLDLDVSEYPLLELPAWVRIANQSIAKAGEQGTECPMTIKLTYKQRSPSDAEQYRYFCIYVDETAADLPKDQRGSEFIYTPVHQGQWYNLKYVLRNYDSLKEAYYLQSILIYANGHDYLSEITDISLTAAQQR